MPAPRSQPPAPNPAQVVAVIPRLRAEVPAETRALLWSQVERPEITQALDAQDAGQSLAQRPPRQEALSLPLLAPKDDARFLLDSPIFQECVFFVAFPRPSAVG